jgi:tetratricopeptide (TPR) repeat protein
MQFPNIPRLVWIIPGILVIAALGIAAGIVIPRWLRPRPEEDPIQAIDKLFTAGTEFEAAGEWSTAVARYDKVLEKFPQHPVAPYQRGVCLQKLGKREEAITVFRSVLSSKNASTTIQDSARERLEELLFPVLTTVQQERFDQAIDYLKTGEDLLPANAPAEVATPADKGPPLYLTPIRHAVDLLERLRGEVPSYVPLYFRLGIAYEHLGDRLNAYEAYDRYLDGYARFKLPLGTQQRFYRGRKAICEAFLRLGKGQVFIRSYQNRASFVSHSLPDKNKWEFARLAGTTTPDDLARARLHMVPGIAGRGGVSFQSGLNPNLYLRPSTPGGEELLFADCSAPHLRESAVFKVVTGLAGAGPGWVSLESVMHPNRFIVSGVGNGLFVRDRAKNLRGFAASSVGLLSTPLASITGPERVRLEEEAFRKAATYWLLGPLVQHQP